MEKIEKDLGMDLSKGHLDVQYSPSKWSNRFSCGCKVIQEHMEFITNESKRIRNEIPSLIGISYGISNSEKLDIIGSDLSDDSPICIFIHGGFWHKLSKEQSAYPAETLYKMGIKLFVVGYALCPMVTLKTITEQINRAFNFILDYAQRNNTQSIHLIGHSAGAHLVINLLGNNTNKLLSSEIIKNVILVSGMYDLRPLLKSQENKILKLSLDDAKDLSPLLWKPKNFEDGNLKKHKNMKIFIVIAENDSPCFRAHSKYFFEKLKNWNLNVFYKDVQGLDHFDIMHSIISKDNDGNQFLFVKMFQEMFQ